MLLEGREVLKELGSSCPQRSSNLPVGSRSLVVKLSVNGPLNSIAYSNGPFFSWLHVPFLGHFFNASLTWDRVTSIRDISFLPEAPGRSLSLLIQLFHPPPITALAFLTKASTCLHPGSWYLLFFLPWGRIHPDISPPSGQLLKLKQAIHQHTDKQVAQQTGPMTVQSHC